MKYILILFLVIFINSSCDNSKLKTKKVKSINLFLQEIMKKDTLSYEQYLISKRCFCRENYLTLTELRSGISHYKKTNSLYHLHDNLKKMGYVFFLALDKEKIASSFEKSIFKEMSQSRNNLSNDFINIDSRDIICEAISSHSNKNYEDFIKLISNKENYNKSIDHYNVYENDETFLEEIIRFYPHKKNLWYNIYDSSKEEVMSIDSL